MKVLGLGPHGERASPPERVSLLPEDIKAARARGLRVGLAMHTLEGDWSTRVVRGIVGMLGECGAAVIDVIDCGFSADAQSAALECLRAQRPDAIISLPVANADVAEAHRRVSEDGIHLTLIDNVPTGLTPGQHYSALVSADNFGLGRMAAELLSPHLPKGARVGLIGYDTEFFPTDQREIAFRSWMEQNRSDARLDVGRFSSFADAERLAEDFVRRDGDSLGGLFVVWDTPCLAALRGLVACGSHVPVTTIDLGREVAGSLASGGPVVGIAAQRPFQQGEAVAKALVTAILGRSCPEWIALPGLPVTRDNVVQTYQAVWREVVPRAVLEGVSLVKPVR
ncbi:substrate-binding domain-containing protein [Histidinibacterium aquaticum]|uniref:Substrate-binding domain-containing protein n=1 Tax=Histidinibacterium aquaticum TaxID=2613962 RepID=A0A5J5GPN4_9RHOB|nr:substrate-binding domain-containing protein [Histidinibacterium aquaticum]KAA9010017.1 substrate-binding domain-containing protein [Histidinibacterium aquaticum]